MLGRTLVTSISTLVMLATAIQTQAQTAGAQSGSQKSDDSRKSGDQGDEGIPDIVVTATRQATNLQDTPIDSWLAPTLPPMCW